VLFLDLFFLALLVRLIFLVPVLLAFARGEPPYLGGDWGAFHDWGEKILSGAGMVTAGQPTAEYTPLYPLFIASIYALAGPVPWLVLLAQTILGALTCLIVAAAAKGLVAHPVGGRCAALVAGIFYALYPPLIKSEHLIMTESLFVFWVAICLFVLVLLERRMVLIGMVWLGLAGALGSLTKPSLAILPFVTGGSLILKEWIQTRRFGPPAVKALVLVLVFVSVLSPWVVRNYRSFGQFVPLGTEGGIVFYDGLNLKDGWKPGFRTHDEITAKASKIESELDRNAFLLRAGWKKLTDNPSRVPFLVGIKTIFFWSPFDWEIFLNGTYSFGFVFLLPLAVCAFLRFKSPDLKGRVDVWNSLALWPAWGLVAYFFVLGIAFIGSPRLRLPSEIGILIMAALGMVRLMQVKKGLNFWIVLGLWLMVNVLIFFFSDTFRALLKVAF
jgi:4-amino-4-deoxy-L-arabinose transferase-like glycosyltransferase